MTSNSLRPRNPGVTAYQSNAKGPDTPNKLVVRLTFPDDLISRKDLDRWRHENLVERVQQLANQLFEYQLRVLDRLASLPEATLTVDRATGILTIAEHGSRRDKSTNQTKPPRKLLVEAPDTGDVAFVLAHYQRSVLYHAAVEQATLGLDVITGTITIEDDLKVLNPAMAPLLERPGEAELTMNVDSDSDDNNDNDSDDSASSRFLYSGSGNSPGGHGSSANNVPSPAGGGESRNDDGGSLEGGVGNLDRGVGYYPDARARLRDLGVDLPRSSRRAYPGRVTMHLHSP
ncbi:hypothetical protein BJ170DRAFT_679159 [Xylariales sp. AK1849]|nr:hypothetical protein BJ170DRAFT_679159 [Xylariales sp. AK1849]